MKSRILVLIGLSLLIVASLISAGNLRRGASSICAPNPHASSGTPLSRDMDSTASAAPIFRSDSFSPSDHSRSPSAISAGKARPFQTTQGSRTPLATFPTNRHRQGRPVLDSAAISSATVDPVEIIIPSGPIAVSAGLPGSTLTANGKTVTVTAYESTPAGNTLAIETSPSPDHTPRPSRGFTLEEELFRSRWGWQAYDQVRHSTETTSQGTN